jgi:diguanylate cyclase (GGDEF)-like protein
MGGHWTQSSLRKSIVALFVVTVVFSLVFSGFVVWQKWNAYVDEIKSSLTRDASTTNALVQQQLIDAIQILDVGKRRLDVVFSKGPATEKMVHDQLRETIDGFRAFDVDQMLGRLFFVDQSGKLFAQSDVYPSPDTDMSDRYYFQEHLKQNTAEIVIADMVQSRLRSDLVFDAVARVNDQNGSMLGVLCQHIIVRRLTEGLNHTLEMRGGGVYTYTESGRLIFAHPYQVAEFEVGRSVHALSLPYQNPGIQGSLETTIPGTNQLQYVGYATGDRFKIVSAEAIPKSKVAVQFFEQNWPMFGLILISGIVVFGLFWRLLRIVASLEEAQKIALSDKLTGLGNRRLMDEVFPRIWRDALRNKAPISILFVDIDHFKVVNDTYGHEAGDHVLAQVALALSAYARRPMDLCCRWGGEEFVCVLPNTSADNAIMLAQLILGDVQALKMEWKNQPLPTVTVSIGVASAVVTDDNFTDDLIDMADKAMLSAKHSGRNCYKL